ncbi:hypothetical protein D0Z08_12740 [Nocardioides immobilis]|uniref:DUF5667 domain-containing protein n=1 Tax=Nocardioides immobilis TaxID=2049295 RepID=A0A417Y1W7_9ACTN|nr:DUF5667 domain-containing protein [Nocardioides immobilis]RHW26633.1 hypothetical protein D0Z08_12740 [Nocardioides immobilis]
MTGAFVSRRRADEFDALLSGHAPARHNATAYVDLLEVVGALQTVPTVTARPDFVSDLRSQLMVEAARQARPVDDALRLRLTPQQRNGVRERRMATVLGGFAIVAASGSMAMASQAALPGEVLYPVKRAIENAHTNLQSGDAAKAETLIAHAEQRLQEAKQLTAEGADASIVAETLQDFTEQSNQATELALDDYAATGDQTAIGELRTFTARSMGDLDALGDVVPADARAALITAAQSVAQADTAAFQVCPTCGEGGVTELPEFATAPMALVTDGLLDFEGSALAIPIEDLRQEAEGMAGDEPVEPTRTDGNRNNGGPTTEPVDDTDVAPVIDPIDEPEEVSGPLGDLGDKITDGIDRDHSGDLDAVNGVVDGVDGLVNGILGN